MQILSAIPRMSKICFSLLFISRIGRAIVGNPPLLSTTIDMLKMEGMFNLQILTKRPHEMLSRVFIRLNLHITRIGSVWWYKFANAMKITVRPKPIVIMLVTHYHKRYSVIVSLNCYWQSANKRSLLLFHSSLYNRDNIGMSGSFN